MTQYKKNKLRGSIYLKLEMKNIKLLKNKIKKTKFSIGNQCIFFNLAWGGKKKLSDLDIRSQLKNVAYAISAIEISNEIGCNKFIQIGTMEEAFTHKYLELDYKKNKKYNRHLIYSVAKILQNMLYN